MNTEGEKIKYGWPQILGDEETERGEKAVWSMSR